MEKTVEKQAHNRSNAGKVAILIAVLLAVAVFANWGSIIEVASGERTLKGIVYGHSRRPDNMIYGWKMPKDVGAEDAKVTIEVFVREGDGCHVPTLVRGQALATIAPDRIRVDFRNTQKKENWARATEVKLGCEQGMAINGQVRFELPQPAQNALDKAPETMYLTAETPGWGPDAMYQIIDSALKEAYDGQGLKISQKQFEDRMAIKSKVFRAKLQQEYEQRKGLQAAQE